MVPSSALIYPKGCVARRKVASMLCHAPNEVYIGEDSHIQAEKRLFEVDSSR